MDKHTKKQAQDFLAHRDTGGNEKNQDPDQGMPKPQSHSKHQPQLQPHNLTLTPAPVSTGLTAGPKNKPLPELKLTAKNLAILNEQSSKKAAKTKTGESVCSDVRTHGVNTVFNQGAEVFLPPPPDTIGNIRAANFREYGREFRRLAEGNDVDALFKKFPSLGNPDTKGRMRAAVAVAALKEQGLYD
ncbi:hypothetical protein F53441_7651 [Fusarium austroafricanum]|uniref:Uncharacterized protein n=1 Tax=Fusarium austroafricanum TaxID=2364996 RepID=A0A8H4KF73_9HYPO|nr:hypothetical protein F53441_7651 [Fusarium austroafricanum]